MSESKFKRTIHAPNFQVDGGSDLVSALAAITSAQGDITSTESDISDLQTLIGNLLDLLAHQATTEVDLGNGFFGISVDTGALPDTDAKSVAHSVADVDYVAFSWGYAQDSMSGATLPLPNVSVTGTFPDNLVRMNVDRTNVVIETGTDRTAFDISRVSFIYSKSS